MADRWLDTDYVDARMGIDVRQSLTQEQSVDLNAFNEMATAKVQGIVRAAGYSTPATVTCELCKMAVYAVLVQTISESPANNLALPENWATSEYKITLQQLIDGDIHPNLALASVGAAIGGWTVSTDPAARTGFTTVDGCCNTPPMPRVTRCKLAGY